MSTTITIPARLLGILRLALLSELRGAAEDLATECGRLCCEKHPEWLAEPRSRVFASCALLDVIGWRTFEHERPADIDLNEHRRSLRRALVSQLETERDLMDVAPEQRNAQRQRERAERRAREIERLLSLTGLLDTSRGEEQ